MLIGKETCKLAVETYGTESQTRMAIEEMGELLTALNHFRRGRCTIEAVQEEIADVLICAEQLACIYGYEETARKMDAKMLRLEDRIKHYNENETDNSNRQTTA